jgi:hypothetical protein
MDLIKGLQNGFFHTWVTGDYYKRISTFNNQFKKYVESGDFKRDVQFAPRDFRYKIDHYYKTSEEDTVPYPYLEFHFGVLKILNIDETFNWKEYLKDNRLEYVNGDFTIGFGEYEYEYSQGQKRILSGYYYKYQGIITSKEHLKNPNKNNNGLGFHFGNIDKLLHDIGSFMGKKGIEHWKIKLRYGLH